MHPSVVQLERQAIIEDVADTHIDAPYLDALLIPVERTFHPLVQSAVDGGDAFVEDIAIAHDGEVVASVEDSPVVDAPGPFKGDIEIMAPLRLQVRITDNHISHISHVEMHVHLLERRSPESAGVIGAEGHPRHLVDDSETLSECLLRRSGEEIVSYASHHVQPVGDVPVELCKSINIVLRVAGVVDELIGCEKVVHEVGTHYQAVPAKSMAVEGMEHMLPVAVVMVMGPRAAGQEVGLVILVVSVRQF